jgi:LmbE family N-acetylglucosaminyl deacetylase
MNVLIVVAHPDDEVLGCGGTIALHAKRGDRVGVLYLTDGVTSRNKEDSNLLRTQIAARVRAAKIARKCLGVFETNLPRIVFPDNQMDTVPLLAIVNSIEHVLKRATPTVVYTHHAGDLNIDHQICHRAVMTACRPLPGSQIRRIYGIEVLSSTEWGSLPFVPTRFVDISSTLSLKMDALRAYDEEMRPFPHARSYEAVEALAKLRGASVGLTAAEAFMVLRDIET